MKNIAIEAAEAVKAAAETLGFEADSDRFCMFVNGNFKPVLDQTVHLRQVLAMSEPQDQSSAAAGGN